MAKQLRSYLFGKPEVASKFSIDTLLIHMLELDEVTDLANSPHAKHFSEAEFVVTNCFSPRWKDLGLHRVKELVGSRQNERILTWVPPNFNAFWPLCEHFGPHGVEKMLKNGATERDIVKAFDQGSFDPCFPERWQDQIGRLKHLDLGCDLKIGDFIDRNHQRTKMFFTSNHPTYNVVAWIGAQLMARLGFQSDSEEACVAAAHDALGTWNTWPETKYEFGHYGFKYPMRYATSTCWGGSKWYHSQIELICARIKKAAVITGAKT